MNLQLHKPSKIIPVRVELPGSKSISNRILIIKAISGLQFDIINLSNSDDTTYLNHAIENYSNTSLIDVGHGGTDMRFLAAFLSLSKGSYELTGSERLQQRPIQDLVNILKYFGADITYKHKEGYPPLLINGKKMDGGRVNISGKVSSQFITALLLVAPYFTNGLELNIEDELVSKPYVVMTVELMKEFGAKVVWNENKITVQPTPYRYNNSFYVVESDWSAASYYYSIIALSEPGTQLTLSKLFNTSLQADTVCQQIYKKFGVTTAFLDNEVVISKNNETPKALLELDFIECPDIAQTIVCTCVALHIPFYFKGLQTLKVKETDRIIALQNECRKFGIELSVTDNSIEWSGAQVSNQNVSGSIATYNDHRMAMSFAPLSLLVNGITIEHAEVVTKSYPEFWQHLKSIGIIINI